MQFLLVFFLSTFFFFFFFKSFISSMKMCGGLFRPQHGRTNIVRNKMATFLCKQQFQMQFLERKVLYFYSNFTEECTYWSSWQYVSISPGNGLAPKKCPAITWNNVDPDLQCQDGWHTEEQNCLASNILKYNFMKYNFHILLDVNFAEVCCKAWADNQVGVELATSHLTEPLLILFTNAYQCTRPQMQCYF